MRDIFYDVLDENSCMSMSTDSLNSDIEQEISFCYDLFPFCTATMKDKLRDSFGGDSDTMSADSLDDTNQMETSNVDLIPFYSGEVPKKTVKHFTKNLKVRICRSEPNKLNPSKSKSKGPNQTARNAVSEFKTSKSNTSQQLRPHVPKQKIYAPKSGLKKSLEILDRKYKNKSYLEIFHKKMGFYASDRSARPDTAKSVCGDSTPRDLSADETADGNFAGDWDTSSFYIKFLDEKMGHQTSVKKYPSNCSVPDSNFSETLKTAENSMHHLNRTSEQELITVAKPLFAKKSKKKDYQTGISCDTDEAKLKLERLQKQREYGLSVSNKNRIRIMQNKIKSESDNIKIICEDLDKCKKHNVIYDSVKDYEYLESDNASLISSNNTEKCSKFRTERKHEFLEKDDGIQWIYNSTHRKRMAELIRHDILRNWQERHVKEQKIIQSIRDCTS